jgi:hypothetical protein
VHPLVEEAMRKAAIAWLTVGPRPAYPVWCLWSDGALHVVSGPGEQPAPGLAEAGQVLVTARGRHGGRIVTWPAEADPVPVGTPAWTAIATQLAARRLNADIVPDLVDRWARECRITRLVPAGPPTT